MNLVVDLFFQTSNYGNGPKYDIDFGTNKGKGDVIPQDSGSELTLEIVSLLQPNQMID